MKIRHKKTNTILDVDEILFVDWHNQKQVVIGPMKDKSALKAIDEAFEDLAPIELPEKVRKVLQAWIDAQDEKISCLEYCEYIDCKSSHFFACGSHSQDNWSIDFDDVFGLKEGKYTLEELGLEAKR